MHTYTHTHTHTYMYIHVYVFTDIHTHTHTHNYHRHTHTHTHTPTQMYTHIYAFSCMYEWHADCIHKNVFTDNLSFSSPLPPSHPSSFPRYVYQLFACASNHQVACLLPEWHAIWLQHAATHRNTSLHTTTHCNSPPRAATHCNVSNGAMSKRLRSKLYAHWMARNLTATHCNTPQHTATHCNTLQHTATHCNTPQHTEKHCIILAGAMGKQPRGRLPAHWMARKSPTRPPSLPCRCVWYVYIDVCIEREKERESRIFVYTYICERERMCVSPARVPSPRRCWICWTYIYMVLKYKEMYIEKTRERESYIYTYMQREIEISFWRIATGRNSL